MKRLGFKQAYIIFVALLLACAFGSTFLLNRHSIESKKEYSVYASCYPVYALCDLLLKDLPDIKLYMLTNPQEAGYTHYTLSDWERAVAQQADIVVSLGGGYEEFSSDAAFSSSICINLLGGLKLSNLQPNTLVFGSGGENQDADPYLYLCSEGAMDLCEALCANLSIADESYSSLYLKNLNNACERFIELEKEVEALELLKGKNVLLAHPAFLYTAQEIGAQITCAIQRDTCEEIDDSLLSEILEYTETSGTSVVLIEKQADAALRQGLSEAGLIVIELDLMLDMDASFGSEGYFQVYRENLSAIRKAYEESHDLH